MKTLANGKPATWAGWRDLAVTAFGPDSPAVGFVDDKIREEGANTEVEAAEHDLLAALATLHAMMTPAEGPDRR